MAGTVRTFISNALENLINYYKEADPSGLKSNYLNYTKHNEFNRIKLLKMSIIVSEWLYAFEDSNWLYNELILLEPTPENYFKHGTLLENFNQINPATIKYEKALDLIDKEKKSDSQLLLKAHILNNLANMLAKNSKILKAINIYEEALLIYIELEKKHPKEYLFDIASTSKNLSSMLASINSMKDAKQRFDIAQKTIKYLLKNEPNNTEYQIEYALVIINGVMYLGKKINKLNKAEKILKKNIDHPKSEYLLELINKLRNE